jgi:glucose/arabinose dehydrogenase
MPDPFVVSQTGTVTRLAPTGPQVVLDISREISSGGERGLLGLAFSTDGTLGYLDATDRDGDTVILEYAFDGAAFDPASKRLVLRIDQPYSNHNGGQLRVGPDGMLYIGMGDGGSGGDPQRRALNKAELLGKLLRIDPTPSGDAEYTVPEDNPFVSDANARPEIYAIGLRNPWRYSFDLVTTDLWIADVGQGDWEEIDVAWADQGRGAGADFGWSAFEGTHPFNEDQQAPDAIAPIYEYSHDTGCSISGGIRYRGAALANLYGWYVYSDYCSGEVYALEIRDDRTAGRQIVLADSLRGVSEIAQGPDGELFVLESGAGKVHALLPKR